MSAKELYNQIVSKLSLYSSEEASAMTFLILEKFGIKRLDILADKEIRFNEYSKLEQIIGRLLNQEPIQYILEEAEFYGRIFFVSEGVLIPRPETEELVKLILEETNIPNPTALDVGTGSGCIAITLSKEWKNAQLIAIDKSEKALSIANRNASDLRAEVTFIQADILHFTIDLPPLDLVVSNPPYIPEKEKNSLFKNVRDFEPGSALFVPDDDPLLFYREMIQKLSPFLKPGGKFYFEIHEHFGEKMKALLISNNLKEVRIIKDLNGKDRMAVGKKA